MEIKRIIDYNNNDIDKNDWLKYGILLTIKIIILALTQWFVLISSFFKNMSYFDE